MAFIMSLQIIHYLPLSLHERRDGSEMSVDVPYGPEKKPWHESLSPLARSPSGRLLVSPPSWDPLESYDYEQEKVTSSWYQVPSTGLSEEQRSKALAETARGVQLSAKDTLGFQANLREFAHAECAQGFLNTHLNNGFDPFGPSYHGLSTLWMERNVLDYYASLWHAKWPHDPKDPESYWGYTLTMGSTLEFQANLREFAHAECAQGFLNTHLNNGFDPFGPSCCVECTKLPFWKICWRKSRTFQMCPLQLSIQAV